MKKHLFFLLLTAAVGSAVSSCQGQFDESESRIVYPEEMMSGTWDDQFVDTLYHYNLTITRNEHNERVAYFALIDKKSGEVKAWTVGKANGYDKTAGVALFNYSATHLKDAGSTFIAIAPNLRDVVIRAYASGREVTRQPIRAHRASTPLIKGPWKGYAADLTEALQVEINVRTLTDGSHQSFATASLLGTPIGEGGVFTAADKGGEIVFTNGEKVSLRFNEQEQLIATYQNKTYVLVRP